MDNSAIINLWLDHYDRLSEQAKVNFMLNLKREWHNKGSVNAHKALLYLVTKWMAEPLNEPKIES